MPPIAMSRLPAPPLPPWLHRELPFERRYLVPVGEHRMHVMETGEGRPVLMVHGNPTWGFLYRKVAAVLHDLDLTEQLRLVVPDLIGLGFSDKPAASAHTLENHGRWMGALVETLNLRDIILVVQDWGGPIGVLGAAERMAGLVVLNTVLSEPKPGFRPTAFHRFAATPGVSRVAFQLLGFPQNAMWAAQADRRSIRGQTARAYRYPLRHLTQRAAPLALARMVPNSHQHPSIPALRRVREKVQAFRGPAAIVWGERDPVLGGARGWIQKLLPQAAYTGTGAGHFLQEEVPGAIAEAIASVQQQLR